MDGLSLPTPNKLHLAPSDIFILFLSSSHLYYLPFTNPWYSFVLFITLSNKKDQINMDRPHLVNDSIPVIALPKINAWMSFVPS